MISLIVCIITGILAGLVAGKLTNRGGGGWLINLVLGILGGVVGGWLFGLLDIGALTGNQWLDPFITVVVGAAVILWIWSLIKK